MSAKLMSQIVFLIIGLVLSMSVYDFVLKTSENPIIAFLSMAVALAFWIGTLTVVIKGKF